MARRAVVPCSVSARSCCKVCCEMTPRVVYQYFFAARSIQMQEGSAKPNKRLDTYSESSSAVNGNVRSLSVSPVGFWLNKTWLTLRGAVSIVHSRLCSNCGGVDNFSLQVGNFHPESKSSPEPFKSSKHPKN